MDGLTYTLGELPQIRELLSVLEQNNLQQQKEEVQALVGYIDSMEDKLSQMMDEMKEMRLEMGKLHDKGIRAQCAPVSYTHLVPFPFSPQCNPDWRAVPFRPARGRL